MMINNNSNNFKHFLNKKVLAIDYGTKNVGTALFQPGHEPFPLEHLLVFNKGRETLLQELCALIEDEFIEVVVVGLPHHKDGNRSAMTEEVDQFAHELSAKNPSIPFYFQDETLSSTEAHSRMKNSPKYNFKLDMSRVDLVAATIILEDFINGETPCPI
ncbi:MAG: Holliday junction resolvase RuvX [Bdellovibrio sp. CG12_big_fil_rev_8_21_14_0_65_39_13]|nr:MAG: Holliday junction resolvase RuvX [Bdellovibrio sp. CG22_combo_CG10-13_8_21_14_all_39_27]PIQ58453.1 MAG: Holliday junction resolvase RuvX [Bdellovibrio sp. CG12_big_fil_rev_8_21_14_0_65_39_13]PIR35406.1 MAG: Holliday junction resolvase RuvX [Bdellovibrio sp. CG11_big_fil_rev_8_21_14_0_20_39_38]